MADENRCEPPPEWRGKDGLHIVAFDDVQEIEKWHAGGMWDSHGKPEHAAGEGMRYIGPYTPPATVAALVTALEKTERKLVTWYRLGSPAGNLGIENAFADADTDVKEARAALALYREEG